MFNALKYIWIYQELTVQSHQAQPSQRDSVSFKRQRSQVRRNSWAGLSHWAASETALTYLQLIAQHRKVVCHCHCTSVKKCVRAWGEKWFFPNLWKVTPKAGTEDRNPKCLETNLSDRNCAGKSNKIHLNYIWHFLGLSYLQRTCSLTLGSSGFNLPPLLLSF